MLENAGRVTGWLYAFWGAFYIIGGFLLTRIRNVALAAGFFGLQVIGLLYWFLMFVASLAYNGAIAFSAIAFLLSTLCLWVSVQALRAVLTIRRLPIS